MSVSVSKREGERATRSTCVVGLHISFLRGETKGGREQKLLKVPQNNQNCGTPARPARVPFWGEGLLLR